MCILEGSHEQGLGSFILKKNKVWVVPIDFYPVLLGVYENMILTEI